VTDLIVPVRLYALVANYKVRKFDEFRRWSPRYSLMLNPEYQSTAEPPPSIYDDVDVKSFEGVHLQWELPEALTAGHIDPGSGESLFPLVPNRWLVVRYAQPGSAMKAAGWVIESDYLEFHDADGDEGTTLYLNPLGGEPPKLDYLGRARALADGAWTEPRSRPLFLTAVGTGLPAYAAFASYQQNVFAFQDTLQDLRDGTSHPPDTTLSYAVVGWYSKDGDDILVRAREIPGLLPPEADPDDLREVIDALGWSAPTGTPATGVCSRYYGTALGVRWEREGDHPESDRPLADGVDVAVGHSTAEAAALLVGEKYRSRRAGELMRALYLGDPDALDGPDGEKEIDELMRRSWFRGHEAGYGWRVVNRPADSADSQPPPPVQPDWVPTLNQHQAEYARELAALIDDQWRLWRVWWMSRLNPKWHHPKNPDYVYDTAKWNAEIAAARSAVSSGLTRVEAALAKIPHGDTPEEMQEAIDAYAEGKHLAVELELKRSPEPAYHVPSDPVLVFSGLGNNDPLTRDGALPCRLGDGLLAEITIGTATHRPGASPLQPPHTAQLPVSCTRLIAELELLDTAVRQNALQPIVEDPDGMSGGPWPEYTRVWKQPWLPMYLQWEAVHCATPYRVGAAEHWTFNGDRYEWSGNGAESGSGLGGRRWTVFEGRSYLTPAFNYVAAEQAKRLAQTAGSELASGLRALAGTLGDDPLLSQTLDGLHDWLLQQDGAAHSVTAPEILPLADETNHNPDGCGQRAQRRFQPVRGGQFYLRNLLIVDRFGRILRKVSGNDSQAAHFDPKRAESVKPDEDLYPNVPGPQRMFQLPPRLLHHTRLNFDAAAIGGWVLFNKFDETLMVYAPDGTALGELRVVLKPGGAREIAWNPLPPSRYDDPADFTGLYPYASGFASGLLGREHGDFTALVKTIDQTLARIGDPSPVEDRSPVRLAGRPVALVRAQIGFEPHGRTLTDPSWDEMPAPAAGSYPDWLWTVRLGDDDLLADGLIGYYCADSPGGTTRYDRMHAVSPAVTGNPYVPPIGTGATLRLPAKASVVHEVTLLACPHTAVIATTDIMPVRRMELDADVTHAAMARIRASFRLNPLLAPERFDGPVPTATGWDQRGDNTPSRALDGGRETYYQSHTAPKPGESWFTVDLGEVRPVAAVDLWLGRDGSDYPSDSVLLQASDDGTEWRELVRSSQRQTEVHHRLDAPLPARYARLGYLNTQTYGVRIRSFQVTTEPSHRSIVMPRPAAWHGDWSWAEPSSAGWTELPILAADSLTHPDDPAPVARAGYLQLEPKGDRR
jgi:F5/8 type C domain